MRAWYRYTDSEGGSCDTVLRGWCGNTGSECAVGEGRCRLGHGLQRELGREMAPYGGAVNCRMVEDRKAASWVLSEFALQR
jgi:hypothetical protein